MRHNDVLDSPTLTAEEAVRLNGLRTVADLKIVEEIYDVYDSKKREYRSSDPLWYTFCLLATCWNAGRIEGVRMERARRKADKKTAVIERTVGFGKPTEEL